MDKIRNIGNIFSPDADTELKNFENLIAEVLKDPEGVQKKIKKERTRKKKELEKSAREKGLHPFLPKVSYNIVRKDETHVFIVRRSVVVEIDINNPQEPVFVSDKLSDMCGMFFDQLGNRLLVFNTSGRAFLYDMVTGNRLLCEIDLKVSDLDAEQLLLVLSDRVLLAETENGKIIKNVMIEYGSSALFMDQHMAFIGTWEQMYKFIF